MTKKPWQGPPYQDSSVKIPAVYIEAITKAVKKSKLPYTGISDFVRDAIRHRLLETDNQGDSDGD